MLHNILQPVSWRTASSLDVRGSYAIRYPIKLGQKAAVQKCAVSILENGLDRSRGLGCGWPVSAQNRSFFAGTSADGFGRLARVADLSGPKVERQSTAFTLKFTRLRSRPIGSALVHDNRGSALPLGATRPRNEAAKDETPLGVVAQPPSNGDRPTATVPVTATRAVLK